MENSIFEQVCFAKKSQLDLALDVERSILTQEHAFGLIHSIAAQAVCLGCPQKVQFPDISSLVLPNHYLL